MELRGPEAFVREQIRAMGVLERILQAARNHPLPDTSGASSSPGSQGPGADAPERSSLQEFFASARLREGKGAHLDRTLLIGYWLDKIEGRVGFTKADIEACYDDLELDHPKHMDQVIGSIRRDHGLFVHAGRNGRYAISDEGVRRAEELRRVGRRR